MYELWVNFKTIGNSSYRLTEEKVRKHLWGVEGESVGVTRFDWSSCRKIFPPSGLRTQPSKHEDT